MHAVHSTFEAEPRVDIVSRNRGDDFLETASGGLAQGHDLDLPALRLCVSRIHAKQIRREESRFFTAGSAANLQDRIPFVVAILGQEQEVDRGFELIPLAFERRNLVGRKLSKIRIGERLLVSGEVLDDLTVSSVGFDHFLELRTFPREPGVALGV